MVGGLIHTSSIFKEHTFPCWFSTLHLPLGPSQTHSYTISKPKTHTVISLKKKKLIS